jgi:hypothetical protein
VAESAEDGAAVGASRHRDLDGLAHALAEQGLAERRVDGDAPVLGGGLDGMDDDVGLLGAVVEADRDRVAELDDPRVVGDVFDRARLVEERPQARQLLGGPVVPLDAVRPPLGVPRAPLGAPRRCS